MPELGRAALVVCLALCAYAAAAGALAAHRGPPVALRAPPRRRRESLRDAGGSARRPRAESEPAEPLHGRAPALPLPRLRRSDGAVRLRDGGAPGGPNGRALDRRDAPLDAPRLGLPRRRSAARRALGLRRGRLGRLLRLGSRRERGAAAVARGDGVPAFG